MGENMLVFIDKLTLDAAPKRTAQGYLVATPRIARTGIQEYSAGELGLKDGDPMRKVRVYRPESEVFHVDALKTLAHMPVTIEHPSTLVDAHNWKELSKGQTGGDVVRDGDFIRVPMMVMDRDAIKTVEDGKIELSVGYTADLEFTPGTTPQGEQYDAVQGHIRGNHLAITDRARGGSQLRVFDSTQPREETQMKVVIVDGIGVNFADDTGAAIVSKALQQRDADKEKTAEELKKEKEEADKLKKDSALKDAEIVTLKKQLADAQMTPAMLDAAVKDRHAVIDAAKKVHPAVVVDNKTNADIQRQVVEAKIGDAAKAWTADQISASFATLTAGVVTDNVRNIVQNQTTTTTAHTVQDAFTKYVDDVSNAWKPQPAAGAR